MALKVRGKFIVKPEFANKEPYDPHQIGWVGKMAKQAESGEVLTVEKIHEDSRRNKRYFSGLYWYCETWVQQCEELYYLKKHSVEL